jgi:peptidoglycan/xylan/chitin deacetylase (PgdA/CDA1 family)
MGSDDPRSCVVREWKKPLSKLEMTCGSAGGLSSCPARQLETDLLLLQARSSQRMWSNTVLWVVFRHGRSKKGNEKEQRALKNLLLHIIGDKADKFCVTHEMAKAIFSKEKNYCFMFDDGYRSIYDVLISAGPGICNKTYIFCVAGRIGCANDWDRSGRLSGKRLLGWDESLELQTLGVKFGSHSLTHADLTNLDDEELEREVKESKRILEERLGQEVEGFAYPFGFFNERVITAVKAAGYKWAVTTSDSVWEGWGNPYRMRRINISGLDPAWLLRAKLNGLYDIKAFWELPKLVGEKIKLTPTRNS